MKKKLTYIPYKTFLTTLFFTSAGTTTALCYPTPPPPPPLAVLEQLPAVENYSYMIPMVIFAILFAFFYIFKKKLAIKDKI